MKKYNFIKKQLSKTNKKNDENYVVSRIWHLLNNSDVKMITQQYIVRDVATKTYALADIYFPQINTIVEIDEPYHLSDEMVLSDTMRQHDIVQAIECEVFRIKVTNDLQEMNEKIDEIVLALRQQFDRIDYQVWDVEQEYNPMTYVQRGYLDATEHVAFKTVKDCCNCFGAGYKGLQGSGAKHKFQDAIDIKALKFYPNANWDNELSANEQYFTEYHTDAEVNASYMKKRLDELRQELALFAHVRSEFGGFEYVFKGWYKVNPKRSLELGKVCYDRISTTMPTYFASDQVAYVKVAKAIENNREIAFFYDKEELERFQERYKDADITYELMSNYS
ncbi:phosphoribosylaminoimidazole carboxylase [Solibacillus sp. A46]|uniref:Phosphoribosylaminoimidazole carboxylase n=1 Tax=Solibacillus faecavium TaxID=2762221 RepID=A0ABR8XXS5_9BACL|nr:phosphoribosylaminoimidazole carboxylase [Solibacillus faecavium]MBD8036733.1 phosphoribosylaminoimidazole carboxylase [Solibacillus faecavium]